MPKLSSVVALLALANPLIGVAADRTSLERTLSDACATPTWTAVHAGEALTALGHPEPVVAAFVNYRSSTEPRLRVGIWRVLARSVAEPGGRAAYVDRIRAVLLDAKAVDRVHALEALAKLDAPFATPAEQAAVVAMTQTPASAPFAWWRLVQAGNAGGGDALVACLRSPDGVCRARAANALAHLPQIDSAGAMRAAFAAESVGSPAYPWLAAGVGGVAALTTLDDPSSANRYAATTYFADHGTPADVARLEALSGDKDPDVRVGVDFALLAIAQRSPPTTQPHFNAAVAASAPRVP